MDYIYIGHYVMEKMTQSEKYLKLVQFVKKLVDENIYEKFENENEINWEAYELLQEIGEIK